MAEPQKDEPSASSQAKGDRDLPILTPARHAAWTALGASLANPLFGSAFLTPTVLELATKNLTKSLLSHTSSETLELQTEISAIRNQVHEKALQIDKLSATSEEKDRQIENLRVQFENLAQKEALAFLLGSVVDTAHGQLLKDSRFRDQFFDANEKSAYVVSVDIRRSTELMLKARSPSAFSTFITELCNDLINIFKANYGVVDKFTGDGILVFFPDFFSGEDAGYFALKACTEAIGSFERCYKKFRSSFTTILKDVGIGVGVDYGAVHLQRMAGSLTVIGQPVVYACRLGGAPAGHIYFNQPAFERINDLYPAVTHFQEAELDLKHEGSIICYDVKLSSERYPPKLPPWASQEDREDKT